MFKKFGRLITRYPKDVGVYPAAFAGIAHRQQPTTYGPSASTLAFQSVPDKFYFLLFGAIGAHFKTVLRWRVELVVVRSVSGALGTGWSAELKRLAPISWLSSQPWLRAYGANIDGVAYRCATWAQPFRDLTDWINSGRLWLQMKQQGEDLSIQFEGIELIDLIIDSYLRFKPSAAFDVSDPFVRRLVWQALRDMRKAQSYFRRVKPRLYLTPYTTYLEHGIPVRAALHNGVDVWAFGNLNRFGKQLTTIHSYHTPDFSGYRSDFEALDCQTERLQQARDQLETRLSGVIDAATSYMRQSAYGQDDVQLPDGLKGAVVVFLHDFYDSPHVYPDLVFDDFWCWICFTIEVLQESSITFFLKPHPNQVELSEAVLVHLREKYPELNWLPPSASNVQLAQAGIACGITVYGTVAHELAYLGIPSICSARHPHHAFDFCRTARSREEYKEMLKTYCEEPLPKAEMRRQALAFYYMHNLNTAGDERDLQQAFVKLWQACNTGAVDEQGVMRAFHALVNLPAFERFIFEMAGVQKYTS